jgi:hypothetical protein
MSVSAANSDDGLVGTSIDMAGRVGVQETIVRLCFAQAPSGFVAEQQHFPAIVFKRPAQALFATLIRLRFGKVWVRASKSKSRRSLVFKNLFHANPGRTML